MVTIYKSILSQRILIIGDIVVLAVITIMGFATHGEVERVARMMTTFIPLIVAWFLIAPFFGLFLDDVIAKPGQLWRVLWAMIVTAPLASWLRGIWLNMSILPIFVLVILGVSAPTMLLWRVVFLIFIRRRRHSYG